MLTSRSLVTVALVLSAAACSSDSPLVPGDQQDELGAEVAFSVAEFSILEEFQIEVKIRNGAGQVVTDMVLVQAEFRRLGDDEWIAVALEGGDDHFSANHMLHSSGDYDFRVRGIRGGDTDFHVLHQEPGQIFFERAHFRAHGTRVEFESFPGEIGEGEEAVLRFWTFEDEEHGGGGHGHVAMPGLTLEVHCFEEGVAVEQHAAEEHEPGVYEAHHTFSEGGNARIEVHFMHGANEVHGGFDLPIKHGH